MSDAEQMETFVCAELCLPSWAKLVICEHGVHNCDSGFRRLTSVANNLPKTIRQTGAAADSQVSLLWPQRAEGTLESALHSHFHSSHDTTGLFALV